MPPFGAGSAESEALRAAIALCLLCQASGEAAGADREDEKAFILQLREKQIGKEGLPGDHIFNFDEIGL